MVKLGQTIEVAPKSKDLPIVVAGANNTPCKFVDSDLKTKKGKYVRFPEREELPEGINEAYVVE